jgi:hypothetical protein
MTPDSSCGRVKCRHALKFHNPCSKCSCQAFTPSDSALATPGTVAALPEGSITRELMDRGVVREDGLIVPKGARP